MAEWDCQKCGKLNLSDESIAGHPAVCQNCRTSITYNPELERLEKEKKSYNEDIQSFRAKINNINDWIEDLQSELADYECQKEEVFEEIKTALNEIEKIERKIKKISDKMLKKHSFEEREANLAKTQVLLGVFS